LSIALLHVTHISSRYTEPGNRKNQHGSQPSKSDMPRSCLEYLCLRDFVEPWLRNLANPIVTCVLLLPLENFLQWTRNDRIRSPVWSFLREKLCGAISNVVLHFWQNLTLSR